MLADQNLRQSWLECGGAASFVNTLTHQQATLEASSSGLFVTEVSSNAIKAGRADAIARIWHVLEMPFLNLAFLPA
jgi:hypothetical protein